MATNEKSLLSRWLRRLLGILILYYRLADRPLSVRIPPPIGRKRPAAESIRLAVEQKRQNVVTITEGSTWCQFWHLGRSLRTAFLLDR
jgi:hypothetical protein